MGRRLSVGGGRCRAGARGGGGRGCSREGRARVRQGRPTTPLSWARGGAARRAGGRERKKENKTAGIAKVNSDMVLSLVVLLGRPSPAESFRYTRAVVGATLFCVRHNSRWYRSHAPYSLARNRQQKGMCQGSKGICHNVAKGTPVPLLGGSLSLSSMPRRLQGEVLGRVPI